MLSTQLTGVPALAKEEEASGPMRATLQRSGSSRSGRDLRRFSSMFTRSLLAAVPPEGSRGSVLGFGPGSVPTLQVQLPPLHDGSSAKHCVYIGSLGCRINLSGGRVLRSQSCQYVWGTML